MTPDTKYYKRHGSTVGATKIVDSTAVALPTNVVLHYVGIDHSGWEPSEADLKPYVDRYLIGNVTLSVTKGSPRIKKQPRSQNPLRRPVHTVPRSTAIVFNYVGINRAIYSPRVTNSVRMSNLLYTMLDNLDSNRTHYILMDAPDKNITLAEYKRYLKLNDRKLSLDYYQLFSLELHKWMTGVPSVLSMLPYNDKEIVLLWRHRGSHVVISMNYLQTLLVSDRPMSFGVSKPNLTDSAMNYIIPNMLLDITESVPVKVFVEESTVDTIQKTMDAVKIDRVELTDKERLFKQLDDLSEADMITAKQYKKMIKIGNRDVPNSYTNEPIEKYIKISPTDIVVKPTVYTTGDYSIDESMLHNTVDGYEGKYIRDIKDKHIASVLNSLQAGGVKVTKHEREDVSNIMGSAEVHKISMIMTDGSASTVQVKIPKLNEDGTFNVNGVEYRTRKQKIDVPIRKTAYNITQLLSYYGVKQFVTRSSLAVDDPYKWVAKRLYLQSVNVDIDVKVLLGDSYDNHNVVPDDYGQLSKYVDRVVSGKYTLSFNYNKRLDYGEDKKDSIAVGKHRTLGVLYMGIDNIIRSKTNVVGTIYDVWGLDNPPRSTAYVKIAGKRIYVGMLLGYILGLSKLLKLLRVTVAVLKPRARAEGLIIPLSDSKLSITDMSPTAELILSGLDKYRTRDMTYAELDNKAGYMAVLVNNDITTRQTAEYTLINDMFVDPITKEYLVTMGEPTEYVPLLIRACEMLTTPDYPDTSDKQRIRGYERFPGAIYSEMVRSIRVARNNNGSNRKVEMSPFAVWGAIKNDSSNKITENTNPIMQLRDVEAVILSGDGGRSADTLTIDARKYHDQDIGTLSESVPDNGNVGLVSFLTANPNISNIYGDKGPDGDFVKGKMAKYYSTTYSMMAGADADDGKRVNMAGVQNQHTIAVSDMELPYVRTGYESILPQRLTDIYTVLAKQSGKVKSINEHGVIVKYKDGTEQGVELGMRYTRAEGALYPNVIVSPLRAKQSFTKGQTIAYHDTFFEVDKWSNQLMYKQQRMATAALYEGSMTYEDSCTMDRTLLDKMTATGMKVYEYTIPFSQAVHNLVKPGTEVFIGDTIMVLEDESTSTGGLDAEVLAALKDIEDNHIKSKQIGIIDRIECIYHGSISDMSPTLASIAKRSNKRLKDIAESTDRPYYSGEVDSEYQYKGSPLMPDTCELRVYTKITNVPANGDKFVISLQLKCTVSDVTDNMRTLSGKLVEIGFSGISVGARVVSSYYRISVMSTLLKELPHKLLEVFDS